MISNKLIRENPGKDVIYFKDDFEDAAFKQVNGDGIYFKLKGGKEFRATSDAHNKRVYDVIIETNIDYITKEEYDKY